MSTPRLYSGWGLLIGIGDVPLARGPEPVLPVHGLGLAAGEPVDFPVEDLQQVWFVADGELRAKLRLALDRFAAVGY